MESVTLWSHRELARWMRRAVALVALCALWLALPLAVASGDTAQTNFVCPCTIFQPTDTPASPAVTDQQPIEVGVKFRSSVDGYVTGVRFYKGVLNAGTHVGHLWSVAGIQLAAATFTGESASGWQEVAFANAVPITANTTYIASYHSDSYYADTHPYFGSAVVNGPLRGLADGEDGPNGVFIYGEGGFPSASFQQDNYFVDVVFNTTIPPDGTPPAIVSRVPPAGATLVNANTTVSATFSEALDPATVSGATFDLRDAGDAPVAASVSYNSLARTASLVPGAALAYSSSYTARLRGGSTGPRVKDLAGNALAADAVWTFTTASPPPPPPNDGPGGPVLVVSAAANPFSRYPVEILRAEGLNEFDAVDLSTLDASTLNAHDVVILGEVTLSAAQVTLLTNWVTAGGTLIAFRPDTQLASLLGVTPAGGTLANAYLKVNTASGPGSGITAETIQFHGIADRYTLSGASSLATLYSDVGTATAYPAVTTRGVGPNGGQAVAFTYDLARSVVYTRQGNPAWAGQERDGVSPRRSDDLFFGAAAGDPQPDWIDLSRVSIPQADEQQRLLANVILRANLHRRPLPRFWYFPKGLKAVVVMTGDDHGDAGMQPRFDLYRVQSPLNCSVDDWECVRASGYEFVGSGFTDAQAQFYTNLGFEVGLHVTSDCADWTPASLESNFATQLATFGSAFPGIPAPRTNRTHCIVWSDWSSQAEIEQAHGIRLDTNYYYWPTSWVQDRPGVFTGSGIPMRFARIDGSLIDCYQVPTQMTDEGGQSYPLHADSLLARALDARGYYGAFCANMHFDQPNHPSSNAIVASAQARGVPVVSAEQMLKWLDGRNGSSFGGLAWNGTTLSFTVAAAAGARNLRGMLPTLASPGVLSGITRNGSAVAYTIETIKGIEYALFPADAGSYVATYFVDTTPPVISAVSVSSRDDGTATVTWTTNEAADSRVDYGTSPAALNSNASSAALVTNHSVALSGLSLSTVYWYRVTSADASSNAATQPPLASSPSSFTTPGQACLLDETAAQFVQGTPGAATAVVTETDGEVVLAPAAAEEFGGAALPAGWQSALWNASGGATVAGGMLSVDGAYAFTTATFGPGTTIEFAATFHADAFENFGFATAGDFTPPWVAIGTADGSSVFARSNGTSDVALGAGLLNTPHRYRITWNPANFTFWVDGTVAATLPAALAAPMVLSASDFNVGGGAVQIDWLRTLPYATAGSYASRIYDSGAAADWGPMIWSASTPAGTSLQLLVRRGNLPAPDATWSAYTAVGSSGTPVGGTSRYLQYRADLATSDPLATPVLRLVHVDCTAHADVAPPVISNVSVTLGADGTSATIGWLTDELATTRVDYGLSPATLGSTASAAALVSTHTLTLSGLSPGVTYFYRVSSVDALANSATSPAPPAAPMAFTLPLPACGVDQTDAHFALGTLTGTYVSTTTDGEVILLPTAASEFGGTSLSPDWTSVPWTGGTSTVASGGVTIDGSRVSPSSTSGFGPGRVLEFVATFGAAPFQHAGFGSGDNSTGEGGMFGGIGQSWAIFSTQSSSTTLFARLNPGADIALGDYLGSPHRFRIEWRADSVVFMIDGASVDRRAAALAGPMRPGASNYTSGGPTLRLDWWRMSDYAASGTFASRVFDAGSTTLWSTLDWTAVLPAGTNLAMSFRSGNTAVPDGSWTAYATVASPGGTIGANARYLQYRAQLATTDPSATPALQDVRITCCASGSAPPAITDLASVTLPVDTNGDGTRTIRVTFTLPAGATQVEVYRAAFGNYPEYDDAPNAGSVPATPAYPPNPARWTLTPLTVSGQTDEVAQRDEYYYAAFARSACGTRSSVSNLTAGRLNYVLGDVHDGQTGHECLGNNIVFTEDISFLGTNYGLTPAVGSAQACLDVGPTATGATDSRPLTDNALDFEDYILFALNYSPTPLATRGTPATAAASKREAQSADAVWVVAPVSAAAGEQFVVPVMISGSGAVHGVSARLTWNAAMAQPIGVTTGALAASQDGLALSAGAGVVDVARLGGSAGFAGTGSLAGVRFQALAAGNPGVGLGTVVARDGANHDVALGQPLAAPGIDLPGRTRLGFASPNPFRSRIAIQLDNARTQRVKLCVYDVSGRIVRRLIDGSQPPGARLVVWDGRDDAGTGSPAGLYVLRLDAGEVRESRRVELIR